MEQNVVALVGVNFAININFDLLSPSSKFFQQEAYCLYYASIIGLSPGDKAQLGQISTIAPLAPAVEVSCYDTM